MPYSLRCVHGDKCFTCFNVWCKKFAHGHESVVDEVLDRLVTVLFRRPM